MRFVTCGKMLVAGACMMTGLYAWGQQTQSPKVQGPSSTDVAVTYNELQVNAVGSSSTWLLGGSVQVHQHVWRRFGLVADVSGLHTSLVSGSNTGLDLVTVVFGPRYTWSPRRRRFSVFGEVLGGTTEAFDSSFPAPIYEAGGVVNHAYSIAVLTGGGMNIPVTRHISIRAIEADWLRTELPNNAANVQNNLRLGAGFVYRIR